MNLKGKKVLVTGAGGFIGGHLVERLCEEEADVRALVHYNSLGRWGWLDTLDCKNQIEVVQGDVTDRDSVRSAMTDCEIVFHLAALIAIPYSYQAPESFVMTNIHGSLNVFSAALEMGVGRVVHTSTSEVYGTARYVPMDESHPLQAQSPYAATKIGADKLAESFHLSFGLPVVTVRPFNAYGPRQSARAIVPTIITQCATTRHLQLGNLSPIRDLTYVRDTVDAFVRAGALPGIEGTVCNAGTGRGISIGDLVTKISEAMGTPVDIEVRDERLRPKGSEVEELRANSAYAKERLGWEPSHTLEEGLALTIKWVTQNIGHYRPGVNVV